MSIEKFFCEETKKLNIILSDKQLSQFDLFFNYLIEENKKINLTSITDKKEVYEKHFLDSLFGCEFLNKNSNIIDVGCGAGFPGIPLAIIDPSSSFLLIDAVRKKIDFIERLIIKLELPNVLVKHTRCEDLAKTSYRENFDFCLSRAVASLPTLLEYCLPLVKLGGTFISYKGKAEEEIALSKNALNILGGKIKEVKTFSLPSFYNRSLITVTKEKNTPLKYPRGKGKEKSCPL